MKKLTAFIAVVALGLLSTLTANAQLNGTLTWKSASIAQKSSGVVVGTTSVLGTAATMPGLSYSSGGLNIGSSGELTPFQTYDLGNTAWNALADGAAANISYTFTSSFDYTIAAAGKSFTESFDIVYDIKTTGLKSLAGNSYVEFTFQRTSSDDLAFFSEVIGGIEYRVSLIDTSFAGSDPKKLFLGNTSSTATVGNYEVVAVVITNPVPEPSTYALMGASGLAALVGFRRIRSKKSNKA